MLYKYYKNNDISNRSNNNNKTNKNFGTVHGNPPPHNAGSAQEGGEEDCRLSPVVFLLSLSCVCGLLHRGQTTMKSALKLLRVKQRMQAMEITSEE